MSFMDVLSALHSVDPDDVGLGNLGKKEDYVGRQIRTWYRSWTASAEAAKYDTPVVHELHDFLSERKPQSRVRRASCMATTACTTACSTPAGELQAVLDWEISTLGDPLADFAYALNSWTEPSDDILEGSDPPTLVDGFVSRADLIERYEEHTGADLSQLRVLRQLQPLEIGVHHPRRVRPLYARPKARLTTWTWTLYRARIGRGIELSAAAAAAIS